MGSVYVNKWHTERLVRYCFYPRERFTVERPNSIKLSVCKERIQGTILFVWLETGNVRIPLALDMGAANAGFSSLVTIGRPPSVRPSTGHQASRMDTSLQSQR